MHSSNSRAPGIGSVMTFFDTARRLLHQKEVSNQPGKRVIQPRLAQYTACCPARKSLYQTSLQQFEKSLISYNSFGSEKNNRQK
jgi:hypothetical protein